MSKHYVAIRNETLDDVRDYAKAKFEANTELNSVMFTVAQYWNDEADDAVHAYMVASPRTTPLWPHVCGDREDTSEIVEGEVCENCSEISWLNFGDNNEPTIAAFAPFCREDGSQDEESRDCYLPYAIARRTASGIDVEVIRTLVRPHDEMLLEDELEAAKAAVLDDRACELFDIACAHPRDDGPRRVLADYLLEREDPRGEYIALALASELDAAAIARRDQLLDEHRWSWIHPLAHVIPREGARFERGLLARAEVFATPATAKLVRGARAWASVETLRYLEHSADVIDPVMRALRDVGPVQDAGLAAIAQAARPWAIETLHAHLASPADVETLARTTTLPALRALTLGGSEPDRMAGPLREATWWHQIESLTLAGSVVDPHAALSGAFDVPRLVIAHLGFGPDATGWSITLDRQTRRLEVTLAGFTPVTTRARLAQQLAGLPDLPTVLVPSTCWQPTEADVAELSRSGRGISLR